MKDFKPSLKQEYNYYKAAKKEDHMFLIGLTFVAGAMAGAIVALIGVM